MSEAADRTSMFASVKFFVTGTLDEKVLKLLESGGATRRRFLVDFVTHVICGKDFDETEIAEAQDLYDLPAVDEKWVWASSKLGRLASPKAYDPLPNKLFSNLVFALAGGLTPNDNKTLYATIRFHGGAIDRNYTERTSVLISPSATGSAYAKALAVGGDRTKVVTPDWVLDCVQEKRLIDAQSYHPRLLIVSSMVIERKIIQVGLVADPETPPKTMQANTEEKKHNPVPIKTTVIPTQGSGIGAMIRPIKVTQQNTIVASTVSGGPTKNIIIQQQAAPPPSAVPVQLNVRPVAVVDSGASAPVKLETDAKSTEKPHIISSQTQVPSSAAVSAPVPTVINVQQVPAQQQQQPSLQTQHQVKITQQTVVVSDQSKASMQVGNPITTLTSIPKPQIVNTKQIQVQMSGGAGAVGQGQPPFQKHIILSQQELAQLQQQPSTANVQVQQVSQNAQGQNIVIIQQQQQPQVQGQDCKPVQQQQQQPQLVQQQQIPQQSQSVPQSPVQTPQFSNVQFIRSNSHPVGSNVGQTGQVQGTQMIISQQGPSGVQQWTTTTTQQGQQTIQVSGQPGQQQQFIRAVGGNVVRGPGPQQQQPGQWTTGGQGPQQGMPQRQLIQLDPQTQAQWAMMDPAKKAEYIAKIQSRRNIMLQRQPMQFQGRPGGGQPTGVVTTTRMTANGQQNIVFRSQWPPQQRQILVRSNAPGLSPIQQQQQQQQQQQMIPGPGGAAQVVTGAAPGQGVVVGGGPQIAQQVMGTVPVQQGQQGTVQVQMDPSALGGQPRPQFQRMTSMPGGQKIIQQQQQQIGGQTIQTTRYVTIDGSPLNPEQVQQMVDGSNQPQMISKTKTALANMLNSRMTGNNGGPGGLPGQPMPADVVEPSAAGTLRMMTAQHNASLNQSMVGPRTPQELVVLQQHQQQQHQQQQQRRTLSNITNASMGAGGVGAGPGGVVVGGAPAIIPGGPPGQPSGPVGHVQMAMAQQGPGGVMKSAAYSPGRAPQPRAQFYGHNPNLPKLPPELFLLGCNFYIVEYDETHAEDLIVWKELIRKHGGEIEAFYCPRVTHVLCRSQRHGVVMQAIRDSKRCVTAHWLNDAIIKKQLLPPWQALHLPAPSTFGRQRPATRHIVSISGFEGEERQRIKKMVEETGAKMTAYFSKQNSVLVCKKLDGLKYKRAKDWGVPVVNATWLSDILMGNLSTMSNFDTSKYQQYNLNCPFRIEYGLVPHLMTSWKAPINLNQESHERLKRCHSEPVPGPKPKRVARTTPSQAPKMEVIPEVINVTKMTEHPLRVMFSQVENVEGLTRAVTAFGGSVVPDAAGATHLVMSKLMRTSKLLQSICTVKHIVFSGWLVESAARGELLPEEKYPLQDAAFEKQFKCDLSQVVKANDRHKLLEGKTFHMTPSVKPSVHALTRMIELSGGRVEKNRRSLIKIHEANAQSTSAATASYIVLSCFNDLHLLADVLRSKQHNRIIVSTTEFIMESIMSQTIQDIDPHIISCV